MPSLVHKLPGSHTSQNITGMSRKLQKTAPWSYFRKVSLPPDLSDAGSLFVADARSLFVADAGSLLVATRLRSM